MKTAIKGNIISAPSLGKLDIIKDGYILLEDGIIQAVTDTLPDELQAVQVEDYGDRLILQSFADMHMHAPQYPLCGMGMDLPLMDWLQAYAFPLEANYRDLEFARKAYHRLAGDFVKNGTTRVCLFSSLHTDATLILMEELENAGLVGYVGKVNMDRNGSPILQETTEESMQETLRWLEGCTFPHIKPMLTPRFTPSCTPELMAFLGKLSKERNLPVQSHLSENLVEMETVHQLEPDCAQYWETYDKYGLFHNRTLMAHCVHCDERERKAMLDKGVTVIHCPDSNTGLCSGFAPVRIMLDEGLQVALGSDIAGGAQLPMLQVISSVVRTAKARRIASGWEEPFLTVPEAYYLGTTAGAHFFGSGNGFAAGDPLHAIVIDETSFPISPRELTLHERFERAIYLGEAKDIVAVYGNGKKLK